MSIRGTVTFECDQPRCYAEAVIDVSAGDENIEQDGLSVQAYAAGWRVTGEGGLICPQCIEAWPRDRDDDDDGRTYADPRDERDERRLA